MQGGDKYVESKSDKKDFSRTLSCRAGKCDADEFEESGDVGENAEYTITIYVQPR